MFFLWSLVGIAALVLVLKIINTVILFKRRNEPRTVATVAHVSKIIPRAVIVAVAVTAVMQIVLLGFGKKASNAEWTPVNTSLQWKEPATYLPTYKTTIPADTKPKYDPKPKEAP